jgi:ABC-type antimicrobial peptide transport system permease subunit
MAYTVSQRTHEIGVRMALGASAGTVRRMVVGQGMRVAGLGVAIGLAAALGVSGVMRSMLYGVTPTDPVTFGGIAGLLAAVALTACLLPAVRASRVDPMDALRAE